MRFPAVGCLAVCPPTSTAVGGSGVVGGLYPPIDKARLINLSTVSGIISSVPKLCNPIAFVQHFKHVVPQVSAAVRGFLNVSLAPALGIPGGTL